MPAIEISLKDTYYFNKTTAFKIVGNNSESDLVIEILGDNKVNLTASIKLFEFNEGLKFGTITNFQEDDRNPVHSTHCMKCDKGANYFLGEKVPESCPECGEHKNYDILNIESLS